MNISDQIKVLCVRSNISQAELARRIGVSPQSLSAQMKRESFTIQELEKIADAVGAAFAVGHVKGGAELAEEYAENYIMIPVAMPELETEDLYENKIIEFYPFERERYVMSIYTKEDIIRITKEEKVNFINLQFTDILGTLKSVSVTTSQLEKALNNRCMFDGSSIDGFVRIEESDMCLYPDLNSFVILPWDECSGKTARLICDVYNSDGTPFEGDPRYVLRRAIKRSRIPPTQSTLPHIISIKYTLIPKLLKNIGTKR